MIVDAADPRPDSTPNSTEPLILDVGRGITLRGRAWGPVDGEPWLVLHGWLDNCASFDFLCPLLLKAAAGRGKPMRLVCLDFAGHGHSSHRHGCSYTTADHVHDTRMAVLRLGWDEFNIIGHSMGGGIAATLAGTIPTKVKRLVILEITGQGGIQPESVPDELSRSLNVLADKHGLGEVVAAAAAAGDPRKQFEAAVEAARTPAVMRGGDPKQIMSMYALFKQATVGPCNTAEPPPIDTKALYKWKAWNALKEMPKDAAAGEYVTLIAALKKQGASKLTESAATQSSGKVKVQYGSVEEAAKGRAAKNFGGTLPMPLATALVARALVPVIAPTTTGELAAVTASGDREAEGQRLWSLSEIEAEQEACKAQAKGIVLGYKWRSDPTLRWPGPGPRFTVKSSRTFAQRIECPVLCITANDGMYQTLFNPGKRFGKDVFSTEARFKLNIVYILAKASTKWGKLASIIGGTGLALLAVARLSGALSGPRQQLKQLGWLGGVLCCQCWFGARTDGPTANERQLLGQLGRLRNPVRQLDCYKQLTHIQLQEGGHHVHMCNPEGVASAVTSWLAQQH